MPRPRGPPTPAALEAEIEATLRTISALDAIEETEQLRKTQEWVRGAPVARFLCV
jgi:hypothetical protein